MPTPEAAEPNLIARAGELIGAALGALLVSTGIKRFRNGKSKESGQEGLDDEQLKRFARAVAIEVVREMIGETQRENDRHREGLTESIGRLEAAVDRLVEQVARSVDAIRDANDKTRDRVADLVAWVRAK